MSSGLALPVSKEENDHIQNIIQGLLQTIYLGLMLEPNVTIQHTIDVSNNSTYSNWKPKFYKYTTTSLLRCTKLNAHGEWSVSSCEIFRSFICKRQIGRYQKPIRCVTVAPNGTAVPSETHLQGDQV